MITVTWQVETAWRDFLIKGIAVNQEGNMHNMPSIEMLYFIPKERAAHVIADWIIHVKELYKDTRVQVVPEMEYPELTKMILFILDVRKVDVRFVTTRNLYYASGVNPKDIWKEISEKYDRNEHIEDIRDAFYRALEVIELQKRIASI